MTTKNEFEALKAEIEAQRVQLQKLHDQLNPKPFEPMVMPRRDLTEGMSMPANAMRAMVDALPASFFADLRADARKPNPVTTGSSPITSSSSSAQSPEPQRKGTGWQNEIPFGPQPGIEHVDRLVDAQDRRDLVENAQKLAQAEAALKEAAKQEGGNDK